MGNSITLLRFMALIIMVWYPINNAYPSTSTYKIQPTFDSEAKVASYAEPSSIVDVANYANGLKKEQGKLWIEDLKITHQINIEKLNQIKKENEIRVKAFKNQFIYDWIILALVAILIIGSTVLIFIQLHMWSESEAGESSLEIGSGGVKVKTPFIGLLMLITSYSFFYLYIDKVYEIRELSSDSAGKKVLSSLEKEGSNGKELVPDVKASSPKG